MIGALATGKPQTQTKAIRDATAKAVQARNLYTEQMVAELTRSFERCSLSLEGASESQANRCARALSALLAMSMRWLGREVLHSLSKSLFALLL